MEVLLLNPNLCTRCTLRPTSKTLEFGSEKGLFFKNMPTRKMGNADSFQIYLAVWLGSKHFTGQNKTKQKKVKSLQRRTNSDSSWNCFFGLLFVAVVIIIIHNGLPQRILPLCLTVKLKCFCSAQREII